MSEDTFAARILEFARGSETGNFEDLALALFSRQFATLPGYREHCESLGVSPATVKQWTDVPAVALGPSAEAEAEQEGTANGFDSAGAGSKREIIPLALPELFDPARLRLIVGPGADAAATILLEALGREAPDGSLVARQRLDAKALRSWLGARQRDRKAVALISDPPGFARLIEVLERRAVKFRLPPGSEAFCALSFQAASKPGGSWNRALAPSLGLPSGACRRILLGPPATTPLLERVEGTARRLDFPHWVRSTPLEAGQLAILDLASVDAPARRIEPDLGLVVS